MDRRAFFGTVAGSLFVALLGVPCAGEAQQSKEIPRLCFLTFDPGTLQTRSPRFDGFFQGLRDLGYVHGGNINISYLSADNNGDRTPSARVYVLPAWPSLRPVSHTRAVRRGCRVHQSVSLRAVGGHLLTVPLGASSSWQSRLL